MSGVHPDAPDDINMINIESSLIKNEKRSLGGCRGKKEYRKHIGVKSIIGRHGSTTYFRGECWNCDHEMICIRSEKQKSLAKCPECGETSFMYKGFFSYDDYPVDEWEPLTADECSDDVYVMVLEKDGEYSKPALLYGTEEKYELSKEPDSYWDSVELLEIIEVEE